MCRRRRAAPGRLTDDSSVPVVLDGCRRRPVALHGDRPVDVLQQQLVGAHQVELEVLLQHARGRIGQRGERDRGGSISAATSVKRICERPAASCTARSWRTIA